MSRIPGEFPCESYVTAWRSGCQTTIVRNHVLACRDCRDELGGDGPSKADLRERKMAELSDHLAEARFMEEAGFAPEREPRAYDEKRSDIVWDRHPITGETPEEVLQRVGSGLDDPTGDPFAYQDEIDESSEGPRQFGQVGSQRRLLIKKGLVAAGILAIGGIGGHFASSASTKPNPVIEYVDKARLASDSELDEKFQKSGRSAVAKILAFGTENEALITVQWIAERNHTALFDLLAVSIGDSRILVRQRAIIACRQVSPLDLKPHLAILTAAELAETDPARLAVIKALNEKVTES